MRSALRGLGGLAVLALGWLAAAAGLAWLHLSTDLGRAALRDALVGSIESQIAGRAELEGLERDGATLRADRFAVQTASGEPVLDLRDVTMLLDAWRSLVARGLVATGARVRSGEVYVVTRGGGRPLIERAFSPPGSGGGSAEPGGRVLDLPDIAFESVDLRLAIGSTDMRLRGVGGRAHIWLERGSDTQLRFRSVSASLSAERGLIPDAELSRLTLTIDPARTVLVDFAGRAQVSGRDVTLAGSAPRRDTGTGVRLCIWTGGGAPLASLLGIGAEIGTSFTSGVSLDVRHSEAPRPPTCGTGSEAS